MKEVTTEAVNKLKPHILIIDDEPKMVDFIKLGLVYEGFEVEYAFDGKVGLKMALDNQFDLIILDLMLPGIDGFEVCKRIRQTQGVPIIMLTARDEVDDRVNGLDFGADDYLTKPFKFKELAARIRAVMRRKSSTTSALENLKPNPDLNLLTVFDLNFDTALRELHRGDRVVELTQREVDLLVLLMNNPNQVLTRETILNKVWGYDFEGDYNVIEVYIRYLRQKLGEPNLIYTVRGVGYVMRSRPKENQVNKQIS